MSGICGIIAFDGAPVDPELLQKMAQAAACHAPRPNRGEKTAVD